MVTDDLPSHFALEHRARDVDWISSSLSTLSHACHMVTYTAYVFVCVVVIQSQVHKGRIKSVVLSEVVVVSTG